MSMILRKTDLMTWGHAECNLDDPAVYFEDGRIARGNPFREVFARKPYAENWVHAER